MKLRRTDPQNFSYKNTSGILKCQTLLFIESAVYSQFIRGGADKSLA